MKTSTIDTNAMPNAPVGKAWDEVSASFDRFCLAAGIETLGAMMEADAEAACGPIAGGRRSGAGRERGIEVGGLASLCSALGRPHAGVDGLGPVQARPA